MKTTLLVALFSVILSTVLGALGAIGQTRALAKKKGVASMLSGLMENIVILPIRLWQIQEPKFSG